MKHTTKLLTVLATVIAVFSLTGCPKPVGEIDDEPIEVVHEHSWGEGVITTKPTCTNKGVRTFTCECGAKRTEEVAPLGHDFQGGYCERCGEYEFETKRHIDIYAFDSIDDFESCCTRGCSSFDSHFRETEHYSFENENEEYTRNEVLHLKSKYIEYEEIYGTTIFYVNSTSSDEWIFYIIPIK